MTLTEWAAGGLKGLSVSTDDIPVGGSGKLLVCPGFPHRQSLYSAICKAGNGDDPCGGCWLSHDVRNAAAIRNKLTIPLNCDMANSLRFAPREMIIDRKSARRV